ncbi:hypothetical protein [Neobacillus kokaensis]|uniref:Ferric oxidoreductase domain-containing protein n=1 Tax=Neobacillus kokaensis TaxID=2759023 RepID=A0ABQ3N8W2_9BACI|nr:hypothetical protein [Neobacillus kokaensis]GHI00745.1 hypothetical protein AM1BK_42870 [Neobacillus kokaensis]
MKNKFREYIPIIIVGLICIALIAFYLYYEPLYHQLEHEKFNGIRQDDDGAGEFFKLFGNGAIIAGTLSFSWYLLKKKLKSPFEYVKIAAKKVFSFHTYFGWTALALVVIHGGYYLITDFKKPDNLTGAAAFLLLLFLAAYGYLLKRNKKRKKTLRSAHFILSIMWIAALLVHGGGFVIGCGVALAVLFVGITWLERRSTVAA